VDKHRWFITALLAWLGAGYALVQMGPSIETSPSLWPIACLLVAVAAGFRRLSKLGLRTLFVIAVLLPLVVRVDFGRDLPMAELFALILEIGLFCGLLVVARKVGLSVDAFEEGARELTLLQEGSEYALDGRHLSAMDRELQRARHFGRPTTLVAIAANGDGIQQSLNSYVQDLQQRLMNSLTRTRVATLLVGQSNSSDITVTHDGQILMLLPETTRDGASAMFERLSRKAHQELGVSLQAGMAVFPDEELTLSGMMKRAEILLHSTPETAQRDDPEHLTAHDNSWRT